MDPILEVSTLDVLIWLIGFVFAIFIFFTSCAYTLWKTYEINALNSFLNLEIFWNYKVKGSNRQEDETCKKHAERLLRSANHWRAAYNAECIIVRRSFSSIICIILYVVIIFLIYLATGNEGKLTWFSFFILIILMVVYIGHGSKENKKIKVKSEDFNKNIICDLLGIFSPTVDGDFEKLKEKIECETKCKNVKWFDDNEEERDSF